MEKSTGVQRAFAISCCAQDSIGSLQQKGLEHEGKSDGAGRGCLLARREGGNTDTRHGCLQMRVGSSGVFSRLWGNESVQGNSDTRGGASFSDRECPCGVYTPSSIGTPTFQWTQGRHTSSRVDS
jgi:hypothetical protein